MEKQKCMFCDGQGIIPEYSHINGGICYNCNGKGVVSNEKIKREQENIEKWEQIRIQQNKKECAEFLFHQKMPFGKYKGKSLFDIYEADKNYLDWLWKNIKDKKIETATKVLLNHKNGNSEVFNELKELVK